MKELFLRLRDKCVHFGVKTVSFFKKLGSFFYHFPRRFVTFWKNFGIGFVRFWRNLPHNTVVFFKTMTKDKAIDLLIGTGAVAIWALPIFIVAYVLVWFLSK
jgi:hypothetical protein